MVTKHALTTQPPKDNKLAHSHADADKAIQTLKLCRLSLRNLLRDAPATQKTARTTKDGLIGAAVFVEPAELVAVAAPVRRRPRATRLLAAVECNGRGGGSRRCTETPAFFFEVCAAVVVVEAHLVAMAYLAMRSVEFEAKACAGALGVSELQRRRDRLKKRDGGGGNVRGRQKVNRVVRGGAFIRRTVVRGRHVGHDCRTGDGQPVIKRAELLFVGAAVLVGDAEVVAKTRGVFQPSEVETVVFAARLRGGHHLAAVRRRGSIRRLISHAIDRLLGNIGAGGHPSFRYPRCSWRGGIGRRLFTVVRNRRVFPVLQVQSPKQHRPIRSVHLRRVLVGRRIANARHAARGIAAAHTAFVVDNAAAAHPHAVEANVACPKAVVVVRRVGARLVVDMLSLCMVGKKIAGRRVRAPRASKAVPTADAALVRARYPTARAGTVRGDEAAGAVDIIYTGCIQRARNIRQEDASALFLCTR